MSHILIDEWCPEGDLAARFDEDETVGALYLITPEAQILAMVKVYNVTDPGWSDVHEDEVAVAWTKGPAGWRCAVHVRGRTRYIDVQQDQPAVQRQAA